MASLKEIRGRINSIATTRKITGAMKMVSSAKLHRAQDAILRFRPYWNKISGIIDAYFENSPDINLGPLTENRTPGKLVIVVFSSNSGLCGSFNTNIRKKLCELIKTHQEIPPHDITIYFIGKKAYDEFEGKNSGYTIHFHNELIEKPNYNSINILTNELIQLFTEKNIDRVELVYNRYKSMAIQHPLNEILLPVTLEESEEKYTGFNYIIEPDAQELTKALVPAVIRLQMYRALLNSYASEHGARTTAMQIATDNAHELIENLKLHYNKLRQDAITKEIIDIVGGSSIIR